MGHSGNNLNPTESYFVPDREREFRLYVIWKSLDHTMSKKLFEQLGVTDDLLLELADIKTQKDFAKKYKLAVDSCTDWNKHIHAGNIAPELKQLDWRYWARQITPRIAASVAKEGIKTGNPAHFNSWMKYVEEFEEKSRHALTDANGESIAKGLADLIAGADKVLEANGESI